MSAFLLAAGAVSLAAAAGRRAVAVAREYRWCRADGFSRFNAARFAWRWTR